MIRRVSAFVTFKDGSAHIAVYKLDNDLPFSKSEMRKWIKEQSNKPIKSIKFLETLTIPEIRGKG
jgi:hypothetical protein